MFTEAERAELDYVTELTRNKKGDPQLFIRLSKFHTEREIGEIIWLVASEHLYNITNIALNIHPDVLCNIAMRNRILVAA